MQKWLPHELVDRCELKLTSADDAEAIVRLARESATDLIALGVEPGVSVYDSLRGTLAERIVQQSGCAVLTMNERAALAPNAGIDWKAADHQVGSLR